MKSTKVERVAEKEEISRVQNSSTELSGSDDLRTGELSAKEGALGPEADESEGEGDIVVEEEGEAEVVEVDEKRAEGKELDEEQDGAEEPDKKGEKEAKKLLPAEYEATIQALKTKQESTYERLLRTAADLENLRKRLHRDVEESRIEARSKVLREILPVMDNLERAVVHAEGSSDISTILSGVKLVLRSFEQVLERLDVHRIQAKGQGFDPNKHEAMSQVETNEMEPGAVVEVLQAGYVIGNRLLRPALVVVAKMQPEKAAGVNGKSATAEGGEHRDAGEKAAAEESVEGGGAEQELQVAESEEKENKAEKGEARDENSSEQVDGKDSDEA